VDNKPTDIGFSGLQQVPAGGAALHYRADDLPRPDFFYFEPGELRREAEIPHDIMRDHQVDPTRKRTLAGIMPNLKLLKTSGNPYPAGPSDPTIQGIMTWAPYVEVSHAFWWVMDEAGEPLPGAEIGRRAAKILPAVIVSRIPDIEHSRVGRHTLRDLRLYGLIGSDGYRYDVWETVWALAKGRQRLSK
jgi:hypothetical protein